MSVKSMLPILGVGSAFAILGLAAARRQAHHQRGGVQPPSPPRPSGVHPRVALEDGAAEMGAPAPALINDFWDAAPESYSLMELQERATSDHETYDALDTEDLTAEWLTRATEAPAGAVYGAYDVDDPAEIAADSLSMISDASRRAATADLDELDELDESDDAADSRV